MDRRLQARVHLSPHGREDGEWRWGKNGLGNTEGTLGLEQGIIAILRFEN